MHAYPRNAFSFLIAETRRCRLALRVLEVKRLFRRVTQTAAFGLSPNSEFLLQKFSLFIYSRIMKPSRFIAVLFLSGLIGSAAQTTLAGAGDLDGMKFGGTITEKGKSNGDKDTLLFENGTFISTACVRYGFSKAPYSSKKAKRGINWSAEVPGTKHPGEKIAWNGTVTGDALTGTMVWKNAKKETEYSVQASRSK